MSQLGTWFRWGTQFLTHKVRFQYIVPAMPHQNLAMSYVRGAKVEEKSLENMAKKSRRSHHLETANLRGYELLSAVVPQIGGFCDPPVPADCEQIGTSRAKWDQVWNRMGPNPGPSF